MSSKVEMADLEARKRQFERELPQWEENGDPLQPWTSYLSWLEDKGLKRHEAYRQAIQKCLKYFGPLSEYYGEIRLTRIYITGAEMCRDPVSIYKHMQSKGIGTKFAIFYRAFSTALAEAGDRQQAIKVLENGIQQAARPVNLLQKALAELKSERKQARTVPDRAAAVMDEKSERNEAFYKQPAIKCCYQKRLVYPPGGGELCLEMIRASLPQYVPLFPDEGGECDMEMTVAQVGHITTFQRPFSSRQREAPADSFEIFQDDEIEPSSRGGRSRVLSDEDVEQKLEQLVLEKDQEMMNSCLSTNHSRDGFHIEDDFSKEIFGDSHQVPVHVAHKENASYRQPLETHTEGAGYRQPLETLKLDHSKHAESTSYRQPLETLGHSKHTDGAGYRQPLETLGHSKHTDGAGYRQPLETLGHSKHTDGAGYRQPLETLGHSKHTDGAGYRQPLETLGHSKHTDGAGYRQPLETLGHSKHTDGAGYRQPLEMLKVDHSRAPNQFQSAPIIQKSFNEQPEVFERDPSVVANKENMVYAQKAQQFDFTPSEGISIPKASSRVKELVARLNFSETEKSLSESLHQKSGLMGTSVHHKSALTDSRRDTSMAMFEATLDCEKRAKLTEEQLMFENEFANTETYQPPSLVNDTDQSFGVFHDSWNVSAKPNNSMGRSALSSREPSHSSMRPLQAREAVRKPLQSLPNPRPQEPSFDDYSLNSYSRQAMDSHYSYQPSHTADSFSVCEDPSQDQSSFVPYHDSWAAGKSTTTQHSINAGDPSHTLGDGRPPLKQMSEERVYEIPMGAPVMRSEGVDEHTTIDQSFTQFDIPHPSKSILYSGNSTPAGHRATNVMRHNFTLDLSMIPRTDLTTTEIPSRTAIKQTLPEQPVSLQQRDAIPPAVQIPEPQLAALEVHTEGSEGFKRSATEAPNLSTITEESENYKSSQSSSRFTVSSGSSRFSSSSNSSHQASTSHIVCGPPDNINPFEPHIVNMMLNNVGVPQKIEMIDRPFQKLRTGCSVMLGREEYDGVRLLSEGGFAKVYTARRGDKIKALKIQSPPLEWEVAAIEQTHSRLVSNNLKQATVCFIQVEAAFRFEGTSVIVMEHYPFGSLLDFVNSQKSSLVSTALSVPLYLTCEIVNAVAALHQCGILHGDIKPDNFMIKDFRMFQDIRSALGRGLCLVDFGRAIDLHCFPEDVTFIGSCKTDGFLGPQMREEKPWKWQVDYFGVAATLYTLLTSSYVDIVKDSDTGLYKPSSPLPRKYRALWGQIIELLINTTDPLPLVELIQPVQRQLMSQAPKRFCTELNAPFHVLVDYIKQVKK